MKSKKDTEETLDRPPAAPSHLGKYAKELWVSLAAELVSSNSLTKKDLTSFEILCENYHIYRETKQAIYNPINPETGKRHKRSLEEYLNGGNSQTTPELTAMNKAFAHYKDLMNNFGLSPLARTKTREEPEQKDTPFQSYMRLMNEHMKGKEKNGK